MFFFFPSLNRNNFRSVTGRLNIMYVFKMQCFSFLDSNGHKNVAVLNLKSVSVWRHLTVPPPRPLPAVAA